MDDLGNPHKDKKGGFRVGKKIREFKEKRRGAYRKGRWTIENIEHQKKKNKGGKYIEGGESLGILYAAVQIEGEGGHRGS